jgi:hypothetical protein
MEYRIISADDHIDMAWLPRISGRSVSQPTGVSGSRGLSTPRRGPIGTVARIDGKRGVADGAG